MKLFYLMKRLFVRTPEALRKKFEPMECLYIHQQIQEQKPANEKTVEELIAKGVELAAEAQAYRDKVQLGVSAYPIKTRKGKYDG